MTSADYYRYQQQLTSGSTVIFPDSKTLVCFMAGLTSRDYYYFMSLQMKKAATEAEKMVIDGRMESEMRLVRERTKFYMENEMKTNNSLWTKFKNMIGMTSQNVLVVDAFENAGMYDFIIASLGRKETPKEVFSPSIRYIITDGNKLVREIF